MKFQAILFDLDGTLLDTLADIANCVNQVLAHHEFPTHPQEAYKTKIGNGVVNLVKAALPADQRGEPMLSACLAEYRELYAQQWNVQTRVYDGVPEMLDGLVRQRLPMAVLSNKPHDFTCDCVRHYLGRWPFALVLGASAAFPHKPDPAAALHIARQLEVPPGKFAYLGDTDVDIQTARRAGMHSVGVLWGLRSRQELENNGAATIIGHPRELEPLLA